ncbi:hypothetical protein R0K05_02730 [Planococcus sp. SIMBA_160]
MKMNEKFFITVPNVAFAWGTDYHLTTDEFMLYSHLQFMRQGSQWNQTYTSVDMIIYFLESETKNKQRDKNKIIKNLEKLVEKGYVTIECNGSIKKDFFLVKQVQEILSSEYIVEIEENNVKRKFKGFTKVTGEQYSLANNEGRALMTIAYVTWRNKIDYKIPKSEWTKVLSIAKSTLEISFNDYQDRFLMVTEGSYYLNELQQVRQETNSHAITDVRKKPVDLASKTKGPKHEEYLDSLRSRVSDIKVLDDNEVFMQIFDKNTFIRFKGFRVWKETKCLIVKESGKKKIESMRASENQYSSKAVDKLEIEYKEYQNNKANSERLAAQHISSEEGDVNSSFNHEFYSSYKKKKSRDITAFLDD